MKKFIKTFITVNLSLFIALSLIVTPILDNPNPIKPLNDLVGQDKDKN